MRSDLIDMDFDNETEINLSPMIDCIFILLIFFIVTTVFVQESGVEVERPDTAATISLPKNSILIAITREGRLYYGGREISVARVRPLVNRILTIEEMPVIIQADQGSSHGLFTKVYSEVKAAGVKNVHFATKD